MGIRRTTLKKLENQLRITLLVAGYNANELHIHLEDNQLVIGGTQDDVE